MNDTLTYDEAAALLDEYAKVVDSRDERIRQAYRAHMNKTDIARHMGIDRGVVIRVLGTDDNEEG
jgi:hypothetical protein